MPRRKSTDPPELAPPAVPARGGTTRTTIRTEHLPDTERDAPLEAWLADLAGDATITHVRIWKRQGGRWAWLGKRNDVLPPFDFDLDALFQQYGDGEYRLVPYDNTGHMRGGRNELIQAGYQGTVRANADGSTTAPADELNAGDLREAIQLERQSLILENLRAARGGGRGEPVTVDRGPDEVERMAALAQILASLQPKPLDLAALLTAVGTILGPLMGKLLSPPDPAERVFALFEKWIDLRDRMGDGGGEGDWKSVLLRAVTSLAESPAVRQALLGASGAPAPAPAALPAATPPRVALPNPPPTPPRVAPSPGNGHPAPATPSDQDAADRHVLAAQVWPLVKRAALARSDDFETYAALIDQQLPGFLEEWSGADTNQAMIVLGSLDPDVLTNIELQQWLLAFHAFVRGDFLQRDDAGPTEERAP